MNRDLLPLKFTIIENAPVLKNKFSREQLDKYEAVGRRLNSYRPFRIVFCGVFSSGKTSLVNCLLSMRDFELPTGINPVTKMITRITYGPDLTCSYFSGGRKILLQPSETLSVIRGKTAIKADNSEITITMPSRFLRDDVEIIDTPGFDDEMGGELERMSRLAILGGDMAVMCCSAIQAGKIFERGLIQELDEICGHFILAVTRMDNIEDEDDRNDVISSVKRLMKGRGDSAEIFGSDYSLVFPVIAAGKTKSLEVFYAHLRNIISSSAIKQKIHAVSDEKCLSLYLKDIRVTAESILSDLRKKLNDLMEEHLRRIRSAEIEAEANNLKFQNAAIKVQNFAEAQIAYRRDLLNAKIREMFNPSSFREQARAEINRVMFALIDDVNKYACGENIYGLGAELSKLYPSYTFYVPAPVLRRKKSRGFIGRTLSTVMDIIDNVLEGTPELIDVDDGYDYSYNDFHGATLKAFDDGPARWLYVRIRIFITHLAPVTKTTGFLSGYEGKIAALNDEIAQWQKLL